jgi:chromosome segregation ATPase
METGIKTILWCVFAACTLIVFGCGKQADDSKPVSEVKAEAEKMNAADLKAAATKYKDAITAKKSELEKLSTKLKEIPVAQALGAEAKEIKAQIDSINKSVSALKERFQVYYDKLKEKGGDLSGLEL